MRNLSLRFQMRSVALSLYVALLLTFVCAPVLAQDTTVLQITQLHLFLSVDGDVVTITQHYILGNLGAAPIPADSEGVVSFSLPETAANIQPIGMENSSLLIDSTTVAETRSIPVGEKSLDGRFSYSISLDDAREIAVPVPLPVGSGVLILTGTGWELTGSKLVPFGTMPAGGENAQAYMVDPLAGGDVLRFSVLPAAAAMPVADPDSQSSSVRDGVLVGGIVLAMAVFLLVFLRRNRTAPAQIPAQVRDEVLKLTVLTRALNEGTIGEVTFARERDALVETIRQKLGQ